MSIVSEKSLIRQAREKTGLNREQFASLMGVHSQTIYNYENGIYAVPMEFISKIKNLLKADQLELACLLEAFRDSIGKIQSLLKGA